jgi:hypothetical protein
LSGERRRARSGCALITSVCLVTAACGGTGHTSTHQASIPRALLREVRPIGKGERFHPPATGPVQGSCRSSLGTRYGAHLEVFGANRVVIVPAGIGTRPPRRQSAGRISSAGCYGSLVTLEPTGVVLVRPGAPLSLDDVFRAWGEPLSNTRLVSFSAARGRAVRAFVDGRRWTRAPASIPLSRHAEIVLEVGPYVPPHHSYKFPPGT